LQFVREREKPLVSIRLRASVVETHCAGSRETFLLDKDSALVPNERTLYTHRRLSAHNFLAGRKRQDTGFLPWEACR